MHAVNLAKVPLESLGVDVDLFCVAWALENPGGGGTRSVLNFQWVLENPGGDVDDE